MDTRKTTGEGLTAPDYVQHAGVLKWVSSMVALCKPAAVHWCDGSVQEYNALCNLLVTHGTFQRLNNHLAVCDIALRDFHLIPKFTQHLCPVTADYPHSYTLCQQFLNNLLTIIAGSTKNNDWG